MSSPIRSRFDVTTVAKLFVSVLFLVALWATVSTLLYESLGASLLVLPSLYVTGVLVVGVFRDATRERWFGVALAVGMVVFGGASYVFEEGGVWSLLFVLAGVAMLLSASYDRS